MTHDNSQDTTRGANQDVVRARPGARASQFGASVDAQNQTGKPSEVRPYLLRLVALIALGLLLMVSAAVFAWQRYGVRLEMAPPLPAGSPEIRR